MPIWAFQKRIIGNPTPEKAAFVSSFADCDELFVINQRFLKNMKNISDNASLQFILTLILHLNLKRVIIREKS